MVAVLGSNPKGSIWRVSKFGDYACTRRLQDCCVLATFRHGWGAPLVFVTAYFEPLVRHDFCMLIQRLGLVELDTQGRAMRLCNRLNVRHRLLV